MGSGTELRAIRALLAVVLVTAFVGEAQALSPDDVRCRSRMAKAVRKLGVTFVKQSLRCHKARMQGAVPAGTDCNLVAQMPGVDKVVRAAEKVESAAIKHCAGASAPAVLGYASCPAPCASIAITDYVSVARCLVCAAQSGGERLLTDTLGSPPAPNVLAGKCQTNIAKAFLKYADKRMKEQHGCQLREDLAPSGAECLTADPKGNIAAARAQSDAKVAKCDSASLVLLDSCSLSVPGEQGCVATAAETASDDLFAALFPSAGGTTGDGYHEIAVLQPDGSTDTMTIYAASPDAGVHGPGPYPVVIYGGGQNHLGVANCSPEALPTSSSHEADAQLLADAGNLTVFVRYRNRGPGAPGLGSIRFRDHWIFDTRGILAAAQWARTEHGSGSGDVAFLGLSMGTWSALWAASTEPALSDLQTGLSIRTVIMAAETGNHFANSRGRYDEALASSSPVSEPIGVLAATSFFADMASAAMGMTQVDAAGLAAGQPLGDLLRGYITELGMEILVANFFEAVPLGADCGVGYGNLPPACSNACLLASYEATYGSIEGFGMPSDYFLPAGLAALTYWDPPTGATDPGAGATDPALATMRAGSPVYAVAGLRAPRALSLLNEADNHYDADARALLVARLVALGASPVTAPVHTAPECQHSSYLDPALDCGVNEILAELAAAFP